MGCDIHSWAEQKKNGKWVAIKKPVFPNTRYNPKSKYFEKEPKLVASPFDWRSYGMYGFLADVRNYSFVPTLVEPRGFPEDASKEVRGDWKYWYGNGHTPSWITAKELLDFNYDQTFEDSRTTKQEASGAWNGAADAGEGNGEQTTFREFLGESYFGQLEALKSLGDPESTRVVFWFDN